jgi:hypothetical protein
VYIDEELKDDELKGEEDDVDRFDRLRGLEDFVYIDKELKDDELKGEELDDEELKDDVDGDVDK